MNRAPQVIVLLFLGFSNVTQMLSPIALRAQNTSPRGAASGEEQQGSAPQNSPCAGQPQSLKDLEASFDKGRRPLASEMTGDWVEIGHMIDRPVDVPKTLNCSGVTQANKLEFVLVATGYSIELHAVGMVGPQTERMKPDNDGGVAFSDVYFGGEVTLVDNHCRLTARGTLACLQHTFIGTESGDEVPMEIGTEFKKMPVEKDQIFQAELPEPCTRRP